MVRLPSDSGPRGLSARAFQAHSGQKSPHHPVVPPSRGLLSLASFHERDPMARHAKPYAERGWYVSRPAGHYLRLCPVEDGMTEAKRLLTMELGKLEAGREKMGGRLPTKMTVTELFLAFLEHVHAEKDDDTFLYYQRWL